MHLLLVARRFCQSESSPIAPLDSKAPGATLRAWSEAWRGHLGESESGDGRVQAVPLTFKRLETMPEQ